MNIIIAGIGKVGYTVAEQLSLEMHDVTIIDTDEYVINDTLQNIDVIGVVGNGTVCRILEDAGVKDADLFVALTGSDEVNLLCCLLAKKLGAKSTIARVRNPEYDSELQLLKETLGLSMIVNPEKEAAAEIQRILKFPTARNVDFFAKGKVDLISFTVDENCLLCNKTVRESFSRIKAKALICAVQRGDDVFIPGGDFVMQKGDIAAVLSTKDEVPAFFKQIGFKSNDVKNVMLIGGGTIAHYLATSLSRLNVNTTIIEKSHDVAESLALLLPKVNIICGDGTNRSLLLEEGLRKADVFCSLTGIDEENIVLSIFAKNVVPKVKAITKVNRSAFQEVTRSIDVGSVIYPKYTTSNIILQYVRSHDKHGTSDVEKLTRIINNKVEVVEFNVAADSILVGKRLQDIELKKNILVGSITRGKESFIPHGQDMILAGDSVVIVTTTQRLSALEDILRG